MKTRRALAATAAAAAAAAALSPLSLMANTTAKDGGSGRPLFTPRSRISDVLAEPAFEGFAPYLLPLETIGGAQSLSRAAAALPLENIARLLPYHTYVSAEASCGILNRMRKRRESTDALWTPLSHADAGLFFYPGRKGAPFVLIAAGGGFVYVGSIHEGFPYAEVMSRCGLNAFVLQYRVTAGGSSAIEDMADGLAHILSHAADYGVSDRHYALMGSSAGARMAAILGRVGPAAFGRPERPKASAVLMAYTGYRDASADDPPTFMVQGTRDGIAPVRVTDARMRALKALGVEVDYMRIEGMPHGFGLGLGTAAQGWVERAVDFFKRQAPLG